MRPFQSHRSVKTALLCLALLVSMGLGDAAQAAELEAEGVVAGLQRWLDGTRDLTGRFVQQLDSGALGAGLVESGRLYIRRPGGMRWEYEDPERKIALVADQKTTLYMEEDREVLLGVLSGEGQLLPLLLLGEGHLSELFEAELLATPKKGGDGSYRVRLTPKTRSDAVEEVILSLRPSKFAIEQAEVLDSLGNRVIYGFVDLKRNRGVSQELFQFQPPPGTTITGSH